MKLKLLTNRATQIKKQLCWPW